MQFKQAEISIDQIDLTDRSYIFTYDPMLTPLITSIQQIGLINSPILEQKAESQYRIVIGLKRILALKQLKEHKIRATIYCPETGEPDYRIFLFTLYENLGTRTFNIIEKANVLYKLVYRYQISNDTIINDFFPLLELGENPQVLDRYLKLVKLEDYLKLAILEDFISIDMALLMQSVSATERQLVFHFFQELKLGKNQQKELFRLMQDLSKSTNQSVEAILNAASIRQILSDARLTPGQKTSQIKGHFLKLRYPRFSKTEDAFRQLKQELKLPPNISLQAPPFFESNNYRIDFRFKNANDFEKILKILNTIAEKHQLKKLEKLDDSHAL